MACQRAARHPDLDHPVLLAYERIDRTTNLATISVISREAGSRPCDITAASSDSRNPAWAPAEAGLPADGGAAAQEAGADAGGG